MLCSTFTRRNLLEGAQPTVGLGVQVVGEVVKARQLERQLHLFKRSKDAQVASVTARNGVGLRKSVELEHGDVPPDTAHTNL